MQSQQEINQLKSQGLIAQSQKYHFTTHEEAIKDLVKYAEKIIDIKRIDDPLLSNWISADDIPDSLNLEFVKKLYSGIINTKEAVKFNESYKADNYPEYYNILRLATFYAHDLNTYTNGKWGRGNERKYNPKPFSSSLFLPIGLLLKHVKTLENVTDIDPQTGQRVINQQKYNQEYEKILLPYLMIISQDALSKGIKAIVPMAGLGCGYFSGEFKGKGLEGNLDDAIRYCLTTNGDKLKGIHLIQREGGKKGTNNEPFAEQFGAIQFRKAEGYQGLLNKSEHWGLNEEEKEAFKQYHIYAATSADAVSMPGNEVHDGSYGSSEPSMVGSTDLLSRIYINMANPGYNPIQRCYVPNIKKEGIKFIQTYDKWREERGQLKVDNDNTKVLFNYELISLDEAISKCVNRDQTISKIHTESQEEEKVQEQGYTSAQEGSQRSKDFRTMLIEQKSQKLSRERSSSH